ncbi:MAG: hypothetical protein WBP12_02020 [Candidatus Saccharimonas sp.]
MSKPLAERYEHFNADAMDAWDILVPSGQEIKSRNLGKYAKFLANDYKIAPGKQLDFSDRQLQLIDEAREFVEKTIGLPVTSEVALFTQLYGDKNGAYDSPMHHVAAKHNLVGSEYGDDIAFGSLMVHEFLHSTGIFTARVLDIQVGKTHGIYTLQPHHVATITPSFTNDNFFEEGLAEEIASRWRLQFDPTLQGRDRELLANHGGPVVPVRMYIPAHPINETVSDTQRGMQYPAHCAFGIQILSEYTSVDLIDLLLQARHPEKQVKASSMLKQVVNSVEPDLYDVLTSAMYTVDDFVDCVDIIKQAIANHAHLQLK